MVTYRQIIILILLISGAFFWIYLTKIIENFDVKNNPTTADVPFTPGAPQAENIQNIMANKTPIDPVSKKPIRSAVEQGAQIIGLQGAYDQFLEFHNNFCSIWTPFINASLNYEIKSEQTDIGSSASAIGNPTPSEYVKILGSREKKTFVDCAISFPNKLEIGVSFQEMPYSVFAYIDSLDWAIERAKKILIDTKANIANISTAKPAPVIGVEKFTDANWTEGFLDLTSQNCENKNGVIRCVVSIDTTNRNLYGRLKERFDEFSGKYGVLNKKVGELKKLLSQLKDLQKQLESGDIDRIKQIYT